MLLTPAQNAGLDHYLWRTAAACALLLPPVASKVLLLRSWPSGRPQTTPAQLVACPEAAWRQVRAACPLESSRQGLLLSRT
jgi:hypothetical protein